MKPGNGWQPTRPANAPVWAFLAYVLAAGPAMALPGVPPDAFLLSLASDGKAILATGDDGLILRSTDDGGHWSQITAPTRAALTRVFMQPGGPDYAVGFDATILRSDDGGVHWALQHSDERADNPLFGVTALPNGAAMAVGGFGHAYAMLPGAAAWTAQNVLAADDDFHLNDLRRTGTTSLLLVGEAALVMASADAGQHWQRITAPVQGSLFGALVLSPQDWLVFGLRGHLLATQDAGQHWRAIDTGTTAELLGGTRLRDGRVLLVGNRGTAVLLDAALHAAQAVPTNGRANLADCVQAPDGTVLAAGENGITVIAVPSTVASQ